MIGTFNVGNIFTAEILNEAGTSVVLANVGTATTSPVTVIIPMGLPSGRYQLRIKSSNPALNNAQNSDVFTVTSTPTIAATANGVKPLSVCAGIALNLSASDGFTSYSWRGPRNYTSTTRSPQLAAAIDGTYTVTGTSSCGTATDSVRVTVTPLPIPNVGASKTVYFWQRPFNLPPPVVQDISMLGQGLMDSLPNKTLLLPMLLLP
ncbi:MAG: hypothetical protein R2822_27240 [Spirosomataceae bacterium]